MACQARAPKQMVIFFGIIPLCRSNQLSNSPWKKQKTNKKINLIFQLQILIASSKKAIKLICINVKNIYIFFVKIYLFFLKAQNWLQYTVHQKAFKQSSEVKPEVYKPLFDYFNSSKPCNELLSHNVHIPHYCVSKSRLCHVSLFNPLLIGNFGIDCHLQVDVWNYKSKQGLQCTTGVNCKLSLWKAWL